MKLKIDNKEIEAPDGATILDAAGIAGVNIPTMCFLNGYEHFTSCMVCMVKDRATGRLLPACSAPAAEGMDIDTNGDEVRQAGKDTLELLLSEHVGDCEGPCRIGCPAFMNIPLMIRQISAGKSLEAIITIKEHIALPAVLGRICPAPCEKVCRRAQCDSAVSICLLERCVADVDLSGISPWRAPCKAPSGKSVAVAGAGPAGLSAAYYLLREGHKCTVYDKGREPGGTLRYTVPEDKLPRDVLDAEIGTIRELGAEFRMEQEVGRHISFKELKEQFNAVVLTVGDIEPEKARLFGVDICRHGISVETKSLKTNVNGVFAGGNAVRQSRMAVRAVADGRTIARSVHQFLNNLNITGPKKSFNSRIGALQNGEVAEFLKGADASERVTPSGGSVSGLSVQEAVKETGRCLHCDCRKSRSCTLRRHADDYGAVQKHYKGEKRRNFEQFLQHSAVIYEPGKCVKCGICVRITEKEGEPLGLTFIGRGFDVRVGVPFSESLAKGLEKTAADCAEACPTGALALREKLI